MKKNKRVFALLAALVIFSVVLLSSIFIVVEADHDCTGENCPICYEISICKNNLKTLSNVVTIVVATTVLVYSYRICCLVHATGRRSESLVTLKVKLSN